MFCKTNRPVSKPPTCDEAASTQHYVKTSDTTYHIHFGSERFTGGEWLPAKRDVADRKHYREGYDADKDVLNIQLDSGEESPRERRTIDVGGVAFVANVEITLKTVEDILHPGTDLER